MYLKEQTIAKLVKKSSSFFTTLVRTIILVGICFVILYPLFTRIFVSLMPLEDVYDLSIRFYPKHFTLKNYIKAWTFLDIPNLAFNTFFYPAITSLVQMASATIVAYGFARYEFPFKKILFAIVILGLVMPPDLLLVPLYIDFRFADVFGIIKAITGDSLNLLDTPWPFIILGATCTGLKNGLYIFLMRQYFRGLPKELEEAAYVDGAGTLKAFVHVFLPSASQIMITVFLFSFTWQYLDTLFSSVFTQNVSLLSTELSRLIGNSEGAEYGMSNLSELSLVRNASMMFLIAPLLILYLFCQKYFTESMERSGLVG